ncbi:sigma-70 family RNA polymerase sigma factor [Limnobacter alexandrii]|jgi:RNA polymerase sigma factor (sigma-70 family)|uniref:sigma-70 family RNA polymerase sigma factor n=1 Tax=Limnobacter alexandrii TaxID=2570352 RepID=UPI00148644B6
MHCDSNPTFQEQALDLEFVHCYGSHLGWLTAWFQRRLSCNGLACELAQDVFLKLYEQRQQLTVIREPKAWLATVAHGLLVNHYRRADLEKAYLTALASHPFQHAPSQEQKAVLFEMLLELDRCLGELPQKVRQAFLLAQLEGKKQEDIASELGVSLSMVKKYMAQAQEKCAAIDKLSVEQRVVSSRALNAMPRHGRRALFKSLAVLFGATGLFYGYRRSDYSADMVTARGEIRTQLLQDGSELTLDSDSAVEIAFTATQNLIVLRRGRVMVRTAGDVGFQQLKPVVKTREGYAQALGTVFSVEQKANTTQVEVFEERVQWRPLRQGEPQILQAGEQAEFGPQGVLSHQSISQAQAAWVRGLYVANSVDLKTWAAEISRYRASRIHCDSAVASWRVSGTFPLTKPEVALAALQDALPVQLIHNEQLAASPVLLVARDRNE